MTHNFFVFGTLMYPEIVSGLLGRVPDMAPATVTGFRRTRIEQPERIARGPASYPCDGHSITGKVVLDLTDEEAALFDLFENAAGGYERAQTVAETDRGEVPVILYVAGEELQQFLTTEDWSQDDFEANHYDYYVNERVPQLLDRWRREGLTH